MGVGNIWRFPYLAAQDGGGVFILVYLALVLTCLFIGWVVKPSWIAAEMELGGARFGRKKLYGVMIRYIAPLIMAVLFVQSTGLLS